MKKPHGSTGNQNAVKDDRGPADTHLHIRVPKEAKREWQASANAENMKLAAWVVKKLDS